MIFGIIGGCRPSVLRILTIDNFEDLGSALLVTVPPFNKVRISRQFTVSGQYYQYCKKYMDLRPSNASSAFFLNYQKGKCTHHTIGINKLGGIGKQVATYLKVPDPKMYTSHSFRRPYY